MQCCPDYSLIQDYLMAESITSTTIFNPLFNMVVSQQHPLLNFLNSLSSKHVNSTYDV